ncbi:MAG: DUF2079 domain-containing protein [Clostridia bacterium]|nr:DUF2079 domain-containing protein [Clostridia bacterium]
MNPTFKQRLRAAFVYDRVVCRVIAAWCAFVAIILLFHSGFSNLAHAQEIPLHLIFLGVCGFFALFSAFALFFPNHHVDSWLLFAFSTLCVIRWLLEFDDEKTPAFLFVLAVIVAYTFFLIYFVRVNASLLSAWQPERRVLVIVSVLIGAVSCGVIATLTCLRYLTFSAPNFDFGLFCNMFHNMKETGLPLVTSERDMLLSHFAVHVSPIYYLFLPFYFLFPSPLTLQIGQAVVLAAGVIPVVLLARHHGLSGRATLLAAALYAFYPAISGGTFYDLHENCFLPLCLLLTFLFYEKKKYIPMYFSALAVLAVKEDAAIYLLVFAVYLLLSERDWIHGSALSVMAVGYFGLCAYLLNRYGMGMMINRFNNLIYNSDDGLLGAIKTALVNPGYLLTQLFSTGKGGWDKIIYTLQMLLPLGLLPFCTKKPSRWLLVTPILINLLTLYPYQYEIGFQYHFGITAFLIYAMIKNLPELALPTRRNLLAVATAACLCLYVFTIIPKLNVYTTRWQSDSDTFRQMDTFLDEAIPADASVASSTFLLAHIADRETIYEVEYHKHKPDVDYVVLDMRSKAYVEPMEAYLEQNYTVSAQLDGKILVLKKN